MTGTTPIDVIMQGDALTKLKELPAESVDCCITSPPYFGLRDYGVEGQIGLEESPEAYVSKLVEVFREVRRVLKKEGTLWLNLGDSYATSPTGIKKNGTGFGAIFDGRDMSGVRSSGTYDKLKASGCKPKDLIGIPWMVAFALRADGWYLRSDIIWHKPNCMPESVTDRPTKSHEYIFLLSKSQRYYYDAGAVKEIAISSDRPQPRAEDKTVYRGAISGGADNRCARGASGYGVSPNGRNKRTVWTIATKPFKEAHFATFPEKLIEPCILAGTSEKGVCPECGKAWERQTDKPHIGDNSKKRGNNREGTDKNRNHFLALPPSGAGSTPYKTIGWLPSCSCSCEPVPAVVLDPFFGAGTTGLVAKKLGRCFIGIELNEAYIGMAQKRIAAVPARLDRWLEVEG